MTNWHYICFWLITNWLIISITCKQRLPRNCYNRKCYCSRTLISCKRKELIEIPFLIPTTPTRDVTEVDLSYNLQTTLPANSFQNLINLKKVILKDNSFEEVHEASFNVSKQDSKEHVSPIEFIDFRNNHLHFFPTCFEKTTSSIASLRKLTTLLIGGNLFGSRIEMNSFAGISNLKKLDLSRNVIRFIPDLFLKKLTFLVDLDLSFNGLEEISNMIFSQHAPLRVLRLNNNELRSFPNDLPSGIAELYLAENNLKNITTPNSKTCLTNYKNLRLLDLSKNEIYFLPNGYFTQLFALRYLDLSGNDLKVIDAGVFSPAKGLRYLFFHDNIRLKRIINFNLSALPQLEYFALHRCSLSLLAVTYCFDKDGFNSSISLKNIWMFGNPILCDCKIKPFVQLLKKRDISLDPGCDTNASQIPESNFKTTLIRKIKKIQIDVTATTCIGPVNRYRTVAGKQLLSIPESDFSCPDETKHIIISCFLGIFAFFGVIPFISILIYIYLSCRRLLAKCCSCNKQKEE